DQQRDDEMPSALNVTCRAPAVFSTLWHQLMACLRRANIGSCRRQEFLRMSLLGDSGFSLRVSGTPWAAFAPLSGAKWTQYAQGEFCALRRLLWGRLSDIAPKGIAPLNRPLRISGNYLRSEWEENLHVQDRQSANGHHAPGRRHAGLRMHSSYGRRSY